MKENTTIDDDIYPFIVTPAQADAMFPELWKNPDRQFFHDLLVFGLDLRPSDPP
jgi:hypothetical protein